MTLETIARLEKALNIDIVKSALTYVSGYTSHTFSRPKYLNEAEGPAYGNNAMNENIEK